VKDLLQQANALAARTQGVVAALEGKPTTALVPHVTPIQPMFGKNTPVRPVQGRGLFALSTPQTLAKRAPAALLGESSPLFKGYPEFDQDQARGQDGRWTAGGGVFAVDRQAWDRNKGKIKQAIGIYSSLDDHYVEVNHALRLGTQLQLGGRGFVPDIKLDYKNMPLRNVVDALDAFTGSHTTKSNIKLYRGVYTDRHSKKFIEFLSGLKPGDVFRDDGFLSTSRSKDIAQTFGRAKGKGFVMEVDVPSGTRVGPLYRYKRKTNNPEMEVILPRGIELTFTGRQGNSLKFALHSAKASKIFKGYPEYNPDQARDSDGRWGGGSIGYREGGTFTHAGQKYDLDKVLAAIDKAPTKKVKVRNLTWVLAYDKPDPKRVARADVTKPVVITRWDGKDVVIDGLHRLERAQQLGMADIPAKFIKDIEFARISKGYPEYNPDQSRNEGGQWTEGGGSTATSGKDKGWTKASPGVEVKSNAPKRPWPWSKIIVGVVAVGTAAAIALRVRDHVVIYALNTVAVKTAGGRALTIYSMGRTPTAQRAIMQAVDSIPAAHFAALQASGMRFMAINRQLGNTTGVPAGVFVGGFYDPRIHALVVPELATTAVGPISVGFQRMTMSAVHEIGHALDFGGKGVAGLTGANSALTRSLTLEFNRLVSTKAGMDLVGRGWLTVYPKEQRRREVFAQLYAARYTPPTNSVFFHNMTQQEVIKAFPNSLRAIDGLRFTTPSTFARAA
jgi:hypothetical protein